LVSQSWTSSNHNTIIALKNVMKNSITFNQEVLGNIFKRKKQVEKKKLKGIQNYLERVDSVRHTILEKGIAK